MMRTILWPTLITPPQNEHVPSRLDSMDKSVVGGQTEK
jgi:hypothetical protein